MSGNKEEVSVRVFVKYLLLASILFSIGVVLSVVVKVPEAQAQAGKPCCSIRAVDSPTGVVTARVEATGKVFQFRVNNAAQLEALKVGQAVYANFKTRQVSLDGKSACCRIMSAAASRASAAAAASSRPGGKSAGDKSSGSLEIPSTFPLPTSGSGGFTLDPEAGSATIFKEIKRGEWGEAYCAPTITMEFEGKKVECKLKSSTSDTRILKCEYDCPDLEKQ